MTKQAFLSQLRKKLCGLPQDDIEECITFYSEMIDDRTEEGLSEEDAIAAIGPVDEIIKSTISDTSFAKIAKERIKPKRHLRIWEILLLLLGAPLWIPLSVAAVALIGSLYISFWAVIISLWAVFVSVSVTSVPGIVNGVMSLFSGNVLQGIGLLAMVLICIGLSILTYYACKAITVGTIALTKKFVLWLKTCLIKKEEAL